MADQTNADLIAENRKWLRLHQANSYQAEAARRMIRVLDALEAADQRADELAAVVEKVRSVIESESGWFRYRAEQVSTVLATAPADVLREHDAKVRADAIRSARDEIMPPVNCELRPDGTEDPEAAEYVAAMSEVHDRLTEQADRIEREAGR